MLYYDGAARRFAQYSPNGRVETRALASRQMEVLTVFGLVQSVH